MAIRVTEMNASDEITIRAQVRDYSFRVLDPDDCRGILTGDKPVTDQQEAMFVEAIHPENCETRSLTELEPGDRAVFLVGRHRIKKLTTSTIREIVWGTL